MICQARFCNPTPEATGGIVWRDEGATRNDVRLTDLLCVRMIQTRSAAQGVEETGAVRRTRSGEEPARPLTGWAWSVTQTGDRRGK